MYLLNQDLNLIVPAQKLKVRIMTLPESRHLTTHVA